MLLPSVMIKHSAGGRRLARSFGRGAATERLVNAACVVVDPERIELSLQVDYVAEKYVVQMAIVHRSRQNRLLRLVAAGQRNLESRIQRSIDGGPKFPALIAD